MYDCSTVLLIDLPMNLAVFLSLLFNVHKMLNARSGGLGGGEATPIEKNRRSAGHTF